MGSEMCIRDRYYIRSSSYFIRPRNAREERIVVTATALDLGYIAIVTSVSSVSE